MNEPRNALLRQAKLHHEKAEQAWVWKKVWHAILIALLTISAFAFVAGVAEPLLYVSGGGSLVHAEAELNGNSAAPGVKMGAKTSRHL